VRFVVEPGGETIPRTVAADAVRFVSNDAELPLYVHADHLATPQKMTDQAASLVWDKAQRPFGETFSVSGAASGPGGNPKRFPGQLYDPETGFHYNYFRDYDPTTGRYLQSDPIGLFGGLNTYAYVSGNPLKKLDPDGRFGLIGCAVGAVVGGVSGGMGGVAKSLGQEANAIGLGGDGLDLLNPSQDKAKELLDDLLEHLNGSEEDPECEEDEIPEPDRPSPLNERQLDMLQNVGLGAAVGAAQGCLIGGFFGPSAISGLSAPTIGFLSGLLL
jgi:RHS repeat-associated protein